jgi:PAS domain S-box-containing protein
VTLVGPAGILTGSLNRQRASEAAGVVAVTIAAVALFGRWAGLPLLGSWSADLPGMKPAAALCLGALGLALTGKDRRFTVAAGLTVASLAALLLSADLLDLNTGMEWLSLRSAVPGGRAADGDAFRILHVSSLAFGLTGAALAFSCFERYRRAGTVMASFAIAIGVFALLSHLTGIDAPYGASSVASPPLPAVAGLLCVGVGILMRIGAMPALRRPRPLWHLLAVLGCAIVVPLLLFGAYAEVNIADAQFREVRSDLMHGAHALSADIDHEIFGEIERLEALAASPSLRQGDFAAFQRQAEASLALRQTGDIMLVGHDLAALANTGQPLGAAREKPVVPEPVERALATGRPQFTDLFMGPVTREAMFAIVFPVKIDSENRYALVRSVSQRALTEPIAAENLQPGWGAVISDVSTHHVLARTPSPTGEGRDGQEIGTVLPPSQQPGVRPGGVFEFADDDGRPFLEAYADSDLTGWETAVREPKALFEAPVRALWRTLGWLALLSVALVATPALWLSRIIGGSVGRVASEAVAGGDGSPVLPGGTPVAEVNALMVELREAAARRQASEDRLRESERHLRLVTDNVPVAISRCDADGRYTFANREFMERQGVSGEEIIGRPVREVIGDQAFAAVEPYLCECLAGTAGECELELRDRNGEPIFVQSHYAPEWRDGTVVGCLGASNDITHLKQAEQRLRASEAAFRQLVDNSPFGIYVVDADFRVVQASVGARRFDLVDRDIGETLRSFWVEPFAAEAIGHFRHTLATGEPYHAPGSVIRRKDTGAVESFDWRIERLTMPDGRFGVVCHFYDLSEREKYEQALSESEATFRAMFDSSAVGKVEVELETGRFLRVNAAMCALVGYSEAELLRRTLFDITHPDDRPWDRESLRRMDGGDLGVFDRQKRYIRKDGSIVWVRVTANVIRSATGRPLRTTAVIQNLNEQKRAEQDLEAGRTRLQLALDAARLGWFQYDPARRSGRGDARFREIFDLTTDETPLEELLKRIHPDDVERASASLASALSPDEPKPSVSHHRVLRRNGDVRWVELHGLANFEGSGRERRVVSLIGTAQDITERKEHEERTHLLMREINHRAKNMLSVVDAIAHQTAARNPEDFIARFSERIQALSANQDLLVRNEWKGVGIADLVRAQLAHLADLIGSRIVVQGPTLRLNATSAQAIGLAIHELSTNAGKYGALSTDSGSVHIRWSTEGDTFHMHWTESGGPAVSAPERRGFGTIVMEVMAERTVGGKVALDYRPSGVTWGLTCPAPNVLERQEQESSAAARIPAELPTGRQPEVTSTEPHRESRATSS